MAPDSDSATFLAQMFEKLTDARFINRIGGFPATYEGLRGILQGNKSRKSTLDTLGSIMVYSMIAYYPIEHIWYLSTFNKSVIKIDSNKWSRWSCQFWSIYILADLASTYIRERKLTHEAEKTQSTETIKQRDTLRWGYTVILADLVMALHWSVENGPITNNQICFVGVYGGIVNLWLKWKKMGV